MSAHATGDDPPGFSFGQYLICLHGIAWREALRFVQQRERFVSALVRPLVWLFIFAAGFRQILGVSIIPPYDTYVLYDVYVTPGLMAMGLAPGLRQPTAWPPRSKGSAKRRRPTTRAN